MCVLSIKVPIRKKSGNLFNDPRISLCRIFLVQSVGSVNCTIPCPWYGSKVSAEVVFNDEDVALVFGLPNFPYILHMYHRN